jgi:hypothetical protein
MLPAVAGVEYIDGPDEVVISLLATKEEVIEEPSEAAEIAEPEVLAKGKQDEEDEG